MKTLVSFLLLAAAASPAAAQDIHVSVAGKSAAVVRADISRAATAVCTSAMLHHDVGFFDLTDCERSVADDALQQVREVSVKPA